MDLAAREIFVGLGVSGQVLVGVDKLVQIDLALLEMPFLIKIY